MELRTTEYVNMTEAEFKAIIERALSDFVKYPVKMVGIQAKTEPKTNTVLGYTVVVERIAEVNNPDNIISILKP